MKLSFIIPVYNVEEYLEGCIDSLLNQGLNSQDYEILLVDDGSTDQSPSICDRYAERYSNIRVIHQENRGLAEARNTGLNHVDSEYICFLDSDDYLLKDGIKQVLKGVGDDQNWQLLMYESWYDFREIPPIDNTISFKGTTHELIKRYNYFPSFCWNFLYRRDFIEENKLRFNYYGCEDTLWTGQVFMLNPRIYRSNAAIHRYVVRANSISTDRSRAKARKLVPDYITVIGLMNDLFERYAAYDPELFRMCIHTLNSKKRYGLTRILTADYTKKEFEEVMKNARKQRFYPIQPWADGIKARLLQKIENVSVSHFIIYRLYCFLFNRIFTPYILPIIHRNLN
ncbi:glycosyltransferase family 2 protein [Hoylesella saccharolytica]|uniref:glycosyltransferase family 2 protein n=1 Tax=Hoylesella saccharolytica TaxID=633701 RepID=UPI00046FD65B|nr:glycosyltransferase [Hoylesella saccharolytica]